MRKLLLFSFVILTGFLFTGRLLYLQVYDDKYANLSESNAVKRVYDYPQRGHIYDREGKLLVSNQPSYDVMVIPREVKPFDTLEFCALLKMSEKTLRERLHKAEVYSPRLPSPIIPQLTKSEYAYLQENMRKYEGFYIQKRSLRDYQIKYGANFLGYISEVNNLDIKKNPYYQSGDLIGRQGVEEEYENVLRGVKGVKYIQKDRFNRDIGTYKNGVLDTLPQAGKDITLTIDSDLQKYGEDLMVNKRGGIVAIEPGTGQILALVAAPNYDPALLVGRERSKNFTDLYFDSIAKPLFDRVLKGEYPPGSPFKTLNALIALQEGVVDPSDSFSCHDGYVYNGRILLGCHHHSSPLSMIPGIAQSCNSYFANVYRRIIDKYPTPQEGTDVWKHHLESFGLGQYLGYDLPAGRPGKIPGSELYDKIYDYPTHKWYSTATISNAIGQGEVITTPMQLANVTAAIANRGWYYTPHIIKNIEDMKGDIPEKFRVKHKTTIDPQYFDPVVEGMAEVYNYGTASLLQIPDIQMCGKTGTAENYTKIDGHRAQLTDHSIFVAFAPKDNPKIAIAVFVENGYWGSRYAGRIAGLMAEKYIKGKITRTDMEDWVLNHSLKDEYDKPLSGKPFPINDGKKISGKFLEYKDESISGKL